MEINFVGGYNDQNDGLLFVFSHKDKKNWSLFKVKATDIPFLGQQASPKSETAQETAVEPEVIVPAE